MRSQNSAASRYLRFWELRGREHAERQECHDGILTQAACRRGSTASLRETTGASLRGLASRLCTLEGLLKSDFDVLLHQILGHIGIVINDGFDQCIV